MLWWRREDEWPSTKRAIFILPTTHATSHTSTMRKHHRPYAPVLCIMAISSFIYRSGAAVVTAFSSHRAPASVKHLQLTSYSPHIRHSSTKSISTTTSLYSVNGNNDGPQTWENPRSRWARKKHRKKMEALAQQEQQENNNSSLDWESFDFGESPKMDKRFNNNDSSPSDETGIPDHVLNTISTDSITYQTYLQSEATIDKDTSRRSIKSQSEILALSPELVQRSIDIISPYVQPRRLERIDEVLNKRTKHTRFLYENPSNPSNVFACLRTLDSFGIQYVDTIVNSESYTGKAAVNQKRGMRTAMGSACWMSIRQFGSLEEAVRYLREEEGCLIYASDLNPNAKDVRDLVWDVDYENKEEQLGDGQTEVKTHKRQRPICIVMGNEDRGISDEMRQLADETFYLPMSGFAESFNLSVATAITLAYMSAVSTRGEEDGDALKGPLRPGDLDSHELQCLRLKGLLNSLAQKRVGKTLLKKGEYCE